MTVYKVGLSKADNEANIKNRRMWGAVLAFTLGGLLVLYVVQTNDIATKGFEIRALGKKVAELERTAQQQQADTSSKRSLESIKTSEQLSQFVAVEKVQYLSGAVASTGVAVR